MSIDDVLSRVATLQQLAGAAASPTVASAATTSASTSASGSSFADALASAADASLPLSALDSSDDDGSDGGLDAGADGSSDALSSLGLASLGSSSSLGSLGSSGALESLSSLGLGSLTGSSSNSASALLEQLALAQANTTTPPPAVSPGTAGTNVLAAAQTQLGVSEDPPGSNDGPALDAYRAAVAGSQPGQPWCAEFVSWAAAQAGEPIGDLGQGLNSVAGITDWASRTGRLLPASATPAPGDLILYGDRHVGIVQSVNTDGSLTTVEGNYGNAVQQVQRSPSEATGYVQM